jgi:FlaA1/EpsC-like NDP-sugar epimerase
MPKAEKTFETSLTYMKSFEGKSVVLTGGTGGIGSKVAKKLLKAGKHLDHKCQARE